MPSKSERNERALRILIDRGIISEEKTVGDLLRVSRELTEVFNSGGDPQDFWFCYGPNFTFFGTDPVETAKK